MSGNLGNVMYKLIVACDKELPIGSKVYMLDFGTQPAILLRKAIYEEHVESYRQGGFTVSDRESYPYYYEASTD